MIRQLGNVPAASASGKHPLLRRLKPARNLTLEVVEQIAGQIRSGRLSPGERLPTEQELMSVLGVSRTVIREAVAALRAEGLVVTRQGAGAFVASDESRVPFRLAPEGLRSIEDVLQVMELRLAIEIEAAAIAARRAGAAAIAVIGNALQAIDRAIDNGEGAVNEDFAFHRAIAAATGNPRFLEFLEFLGRHVIPRQSIRAMIGDAEQQRRYLRRIQREHARIFEALRAGRPAEARQAMRTHLTRGLERYRQIAALSAAAADGNPVSR
jgi:GntR family transcriptional repressor for pyruvate dehydrogenase complex